jgi:monofunctional biosynthetic peptidoglycan transglycosylase
VLALLALGLGLPPLVAADLGLTWLWYRPRIAALAGTVPAETEYMRRAVAAGQPPLARSWASLDSIGPTAMCAVLAAEDVLFFRHGTLDYASQRRMLNNLLQGDFSTGGSTIAQQLARNIFLGPDRTPRRKLREYILAYAISHALTKERQLELYLNLVEWGPGVWGVDAGTRHWFGKPPAALTPSEAVVLATLLPAPRRGLAYAAAPAARESQDWALRTLWETTLLDGVGRGATAARVRRWTDHLAAGRTAVEARALIERELGPEPQAEGVVEARGRPPARRCDPDRRSTD